MYAQSEYFPPHVPLQSLWDLIVVTVPAPGPAGSARAGAGGVSSCPTSACTRRAALHRGASSTDALMAWPSPHRTVVSLLGNAVAAVGVPLSCGHQEPRRLSRPRVKRYATATAGSVCGSATPPPPRDPDRQRGLRLTSPPYWVRGGDARAPRYARELATGSAPMRRVLADHGDMWLVIGDRHTASSGSAATAS